MAEPRYFLLIAFLAGVALYLCTHGRSALRSGTLWIEQLLHETADDDLLVWHRVSGDEWPAGTVAAVHLRRSWLTRRACVPYLEFSGPDGDPFVSCHFTNLYLLPEPTSTRLKPVFLYLHEVSSPTAAGAADEVAKVQRKLAKISMISLRQHAIQHAFLVVGLRAAGKLRSGHSAHDTRSDRDGSSSSSWPSWHPALSMAHEPQTIMLTRSTPQNVGHWVWDDLTAIISLMDDFGAADADSGGALPALPPLAPGTLGPLPPLPETALPFRQQQLVFFEGDYPRADILPHWECRLCEAITTAMFDNEPVWLQELLDEAGARAVRFRSIYLGVGGRGAHDIAPNYAVYGAERRLLWRLRHAVLQGVGMLPQAEERRAELGTPSAPLQVRILQKLDKRRILNLDAVVSGIQLALDAVSLPGGANVTVLRWEESSGGLLGEIRTLLSTDILVSIDGTGANTHFFMRPGSVLVSLGTRQGPLADFLPAVDDHVRVLYYSDDRGVGLLPSGGNHEDAVVDVNTLAPLLTRAARLVHSAFPVPVPHGINHRISGFVCRYLGQRYGAFGAHGRDWWMLDTHQACITLLNDPAASWQRWMGGQLMPDSFLGDHAAALRAYAALHAGDP